MTDAARTWWNSWSDAFQSLHTGPDIAFGPGAPPGEDFGLLGEVEGLDVIELGCGGGQFGVALAKQGANVVGVDISEAQLAHARSLADEHDVDVDLVQGSVTDLEMLPADRFDLAVSAWAFEWVEDIDACFREAHRLLRADGRFVFSDEHPVYQLFDAETHTLDRSYFDADPRREYSDRFEAELVQYRRSTADLLNAVIDAGFTVERIEEPGSTDPEDYAADDLSFDPELMAQVPPTLVVAARA